MSSSWQLLISDRKKQLLQKNHFFETNYNQKFKYFLLHQATTSSILYTKISSSFRLTLDKFEGNGCCKPQYLR